VSVTIADAAGRSYRYTGFNDDNPGTDDGQAPRHLRLTALAHVGTAVRAGQIIGFLGDTDPMPSNEHRGIADGDAIWPHLRLTIHAADGTQLDADTLVTSAQMRRACHVGIGPWSVPADPALDDLDVDDVPVDALLDGSWTIHDDGTVTATGKSTLIMPPQGCQWAGPDKAFGPAAGGGQATKWVGTVDVPAQFWVTSSLAASNLPTMVFAG
jgi:hypothetical protein